MINNRLKQNDYENAAKLLGCDIPTVKAICAVESHGRGFNPDGSPLTLFEGHKFYKYTLGKYADIAPDLCYPKWTKQFYGKTWKEEQIRLDRAIALDKQAAYLSTSWGMFQIMGFNYASCGFKSVDDFVLMMKESEGCQLDAFCRFVIAIGAADELRNKDWVGFAKLYNGPAYLQNDYDHKLTVAYNRELHSQSKMT